MPEMPVMIANLVSKCKLTLFYNLDQLKHSEMTRNLGNFALNIPIILLQISVLLQFFPSVSRILISVFLKYPVFP